MNYYKVIAKCGHVGKGKYTEVAFPIYSESASEAAQYVLKLPKVKKQLKDAITSVKRISYEEYKELIEDKRNNKYYRTHTKRELMSIIDELLIENNNKRYKEYKKSFEDRKERVSYILRKTKIIREAYAYELSI